MIRNKEQTGVEFVGEQYDFGSETFIPAHVPAGSLVLIHGGVVHRSEANKSEIPRNAYTFHVIEGFEGGDQERGVKYSSKNWLQPRPNPIADFTK